MLVPAYAAAIHKSQGSEYPAVIIPVLTQHYPMLQRNLLYTGVTRGKRLVVLVGQKKAVAIAVRNASGRRRWSKLGENGCALASITFPLLHYFPAESPRAMTGVFIRERSRPLLSLY
jgi:exodeoxyribonuclease V alpha subunit